MGIGAHFNIMIGAKASNGGSEIVTKANSQNSAGSFVLINSLEANGNPNAVVFETPNADPKGKGGTFDAAPTGVEYFQSPTDDWSVFQEDGSSMTLKYSFNVLSFSS